jgi:hypothetical protein
VLTHDLEWIPLGKHSLTWEMVHPIGHYDTPPISRFGKLYKVFEHMFILKRGDLMHMFGWLFYYIWFTWHDIVTCGPLCSKTQVFQQRMNTFSNHSHNQIKDQHTDVLTWYNPYGDTSTSPANATTWSSLLMQKKNITKIFYKRVSYNRSSVNDPPCCLNRDHGPIRC